MIEEVLSLAPQPGMVPPSASLGRTAGAITARAADPSPSPHRARYRPDDNDSPPPSSTSTASSLMTFRVSFAAVILLKSTTGKNSAERRRGRASTPIMSAKVVAEDKSEERAEYTGQEGRRGFEVAFGKILNGLRGCRVDQNCRSAQHGNDEQPNERVSEEPNDFKRNRFRGARMLRICPASVLNRFHFNIRRLRIDMGTSAAAASWLGWFNAYVANIVNSFFRWRFQRPLPTCYLSLPTYAVSVLRITPAGSLVNTLTLQESTCFL